MATAPTPGSIDEYIAGFPPDVQKVMEEFREIINSAAPEATETIRYGMPTFDLNGHYLVYFAGFKNHVSLFPYTGAMAEAFKEELAPHISGKGTLQFPLSEPVPADLIRRIVEFRVVEESSREGSGYGSRTS